MKKIAYAFLIAATISTLLISFDMIDNHYSITTVLFILWSISPYGFLAVLIKIARSKTAIITTLILSAAIPFFGLALIIDALYIHIDAQGGLVYLFAPLWQWLCVLVMTITILLLNKINNA